MAEYLVQSASLTAVADAIRQKGGTTAPLAFPEGFVSAVAAIETGGGTTEDRLAQLSEGTLTELVDSQITAISQSYLFYRNTVLTRVELPNAAGTCADSAFYSNTNLKTCKLPKITAVGNSSFMSAGLVDTDFSALETIGQYAFRSCTKLARLDFPALKSIASHNNFNGCSRLATLILRSNTMVTLAATNAFTGTPIASGTGYIYVPAALVSTYQADSVWSTFADQFRAIEDYPDV